ncbi:MAG: hypothetical protein RL754_239 [Bacteroidota bacterium]|jgi:ADP-ribose pyrophosphatase YjhB (NUDIX family)
MKLVRFNARNYVFIISEEDRVMVLKEHWHGVDLNKLPGGGMELGEGMIECLNREISEEFELWTPLEYRHVYTPTHCFSSCFRPEEQLILNYFRSTEKVHERSWLLRIDDNLLGLHWLPLSRQSALWFTLDTDREAFLSLLDQLEIED